MEPIAIKRVILIAIENLVPASNDLFQSLYSQYAPDFLCFCLDTGHQHIYPQNPGPLELFKDRLGAVHLHDNDGSDDQHRLIFDGSIDWDRIAALMADSAYAKCINMELKWDRAAYPDEMDFLSRAR